MTLIEQNLVTSVHVDNEALINFKCLQSQDGAVFGCKVSNNSGKVRVSKGTLSIRGYRIEFPQDEDIYDLNSYQTNDTSNFLLCLRITYTEEDRNATLETIIQRESIALQNTAIEEGRAGSFDYPLVRFAKSSGSISKFESLAKTISLIQYPEIATDEEVKAALGIS